MTVRDLPDTGREALALDIGGTKLAVGVVDMTGRLRERKAIATERSAGATEVLSRALALLEGVLAEATSRGSAPVALGVATNGITREDRVDIAPAVSGWKELRIPAALRDRFPQLPLVIINDVKAATVAEMTWGALRGVRDGLYVNLGTGFAVGIVAAGRLLQGANGAAGEAGYIVPSLELLAEHQPGEATLEERIGGRGVESWTQKELGATLTVAELMETSLHDRRAAALRDRFVSETALWIANIASVIDPALIVLGGGVVRSVHDLTARTRQLVSMLTPFPAEVRLAHFESDSALLGAGAVALSGETHLGASSAESLHDLG